MSDWISVENELPAYYAPCWVNGSPYANKGDLWAIAIRSPAGWFAIETAFGWMCEAHSEPEISYDDMDILDDVTHWQPLKMPEPIK